MTPGVSLRKYCWRASRQINLLLPLNLNIVAVLYTSSVITNNRQKGSHQCLAAKREERWIRADRRTAPPLRRATAPLRASTAPHPPSLPVHRPHPPTHPSHLRTDMRPPRRQVAGNMVHRVVDRRSLRRIRFRSIRPNRPGWTLDYARKIRVRGARIAPCLPRRMSVRPCRLARSHSQYRPTGM